MPNIANSPPGNQSASPGVCKAKVSALARRIAAHYEFIEQATHRPDGVLMPPPVPRPSLVHLIGARIRREERLALRRRQLELQFGPPPRTEGVAPCR